ncbi:dipeptide ABC transporter ATP-binding protein [Nocardia altamirensis]|uniref:dipeptide ABC transporter ATP-binding protein n=1 Tax=Nocardia altamirensis TaxID=472158 RepID=UPI0008408D22|nr:ABC transporter ATP-binding protein [Nocardia altamirensis]
MTPSPVLAVHDLGIAIDDRPILRDLSFEIERGKTLALVGESGSGKSLTALAVLGLLPPGSTTAGTVTLAGKHLFGMKPDVLRQVRRNDVGVVFQDPAAAFDPVYRIGQQLREVIRSTRKCTKPQANAMVLDLFERVKIDDPERVADSYPHEISGGQLQRAMIAMAISRGPQLLIADEPTTALDANVQAEVLQLFRELQQDNDIAILLITHDMGVVADLADDVVVLRDGSPVETGPTRQVLIAPQQDYTKTLLDAVLQLEPPVPAPSSAVEEAKPVLAVENLTVDYRKGGVRFTALRDANLVVHEHHIVALVGESGAGKSTLGRALCGLVTPSAGRVTLNGEPIPVLQKRSRRALGKQLGVVFQDPMSSLNPQHTVLQSVELPLLVHTELDSRQRRERVEELLDEVSLDPDLITRYPRQLSGGQRQRVAIARALAVQPDVLVMDEPTSALDAAVQASVLALIRRLQSTHGFAAVFITHDFAIVQQLADHVVVLRNGAIIEQGPTAQVLTAPRSPYTQRLLLAVPVAEPTAQQHRRALWAQTQPNLPAFQSGSHATAEPLVKH